MPRNEIYDVTQAEAAILAAAREEVLESIAQLMGTGGADARDEAAAAWDTYARLIEGDGTSACQGFPAVKALRDHLREAATHATATRSLAGAAKSTAGAFDRLDQKARDLIYARFQVADAVCTVAAMLGAAVRWDTVAERAAPPA